MPLAVANLEWGNPVERSEVCGGDEFLAARDQTELQQSNKAMALHQHCPECCPAPTGNHCVKPTSNVGGRGINPRLSQAKDLTKFMLLDILPCVRHY